VLGYWFAVIAASLINYFTTTLQYIFFVLLLVDERFPWTDSCGLNLLRFWVLCRPVLKPTRGRSELVLFHCRGICRFIFQ
jgi:hypothetical protein